MTALVYISAGFFLCGVCMFFLLILGNQASFQAINMFHWLSISIDSEWRRKTVGG